MTFRASDKSLVYRFCGGSLLFLFVAVIILLNMRQIMRTDWNTFSLISNDGLAFTLSPYNFITIIMATGICILVAFLYYRFVHGTIKYSDFGQSNYSLFGHTKCSAFPKTLVE